MLAMSKHYRFLAIVAGSFLIIGVLVLLWRNPFSPKPGLAPSPTPAISGPQETNLEGVIICLPHRDTSGPQTLECAIGLQTSQGNYALDTNQQPDLAPKLINGNRFKAHGLITPIEYLSTDHWQKYDVQGIFSVRDSVELSPN